MKIGPCEVAERLSGLPHKKIARLFPAPFCPKWADCFQNSLNIVTFNMSTYTEFGPHRLRFAGLIPEIDFSAQKS